MNTGSFYAEGPTVQQTFHLIIAVFGLVALLALGAVHLVRRRRTGDVGGTRDSGPKR